MEAKDLRIGNLIKYIDGKYRRVSMIDKDGNGVGALERIGICEIENWKPIPLTVDWLIKFGFEYSKILDCYVIRYNRYLRKYSSFWSMFQSNETPPSLSMNTQLSEFKHVHQLQNLYFALTGEDLTIK